MPNCKLLSAEHGFGRNPALIVFTAIQLEECGMNLPYLTGRCSLQPGSLIALTATRVGLCAGEGSVQGSCSLTSSPIARDRKDHHFPVLCATSYLVRKPLWREGTVHSDICLLCGGRLSWPHIETCPCLSDLGITAGAREYLPTLPGTTVEGNAERG